MRLRSNISLFTAALFCLVVSAPGLALAAGYTITGRGVRALSRGGAPIAGTDDLNAQWFNPARLAHSSAKFAAYVDGALIHRSLTFTRMPDLQVMTYDPQFADGFSPVSNGRPMQIVPAVALGSNLGLSDFMFVLGAYTQQAVQAEWPEGGPQRYTLVNSEAIELIYQASVAWRPVRGLSIGVGFQLRDFLLRQDMVVSAYPGIFSWQEDPTLDALIRVEAEDRMIPTAVFGVWYSPHPQWEVGASVQLGFDVHGAGSIFYRKPEHYYFAPTSFTGKNILVDLSFPLTARLGVLYRAGRRWDAEISYVFTRWSSHTGIQVRPNPQGSIYFSDVPGLGTYTIRPFEAKQNFKDSHSVHLGGQYRLSGTGLEFRGGGYMETSAIPDASLTIQPMDAMKFMGGAGISYTLGITRINLGYALVWYVPTTVTTSTKTQVNLLYGEDQGPSGAGGPSIVGNGRYRSIAHVVGLSIDLSLSPTESTR
jgi:long-chain fatty acid transport protein